jgi:hypothetical protein
VEITHRFRSDTLDDTRETPCPKMSPSEAVNAYRVSQYVVQLSSLVLSLEPPSASPKERKELLAHSLINKAKFEQLNLNKIDSSIWP